MRTLTLPRLPDDGRDYQLTVAPSGLLCLLISDPAADASSCVFQFGAGSHDEPAQLPGLAHLLEHMLFMGSADYPHAGSFPRLVSEWAGRFNASTGPERTRYHFSVSPAGLEPCLAQLTDMLVAPLFAPEAVAAERQVIDAEFHTRLADAALHEQAALSQAFHPDHPLSRFSAGNQRSLAGSPQALTQALREFHAQFYRAASGCVLIHAPLPLCQLQFLAEQAAARFPAGAPAPRSSAIPLFDRSRLPGWLRWRSPGHKQSHLLFFALEGMHNKEGAQALRWLCEWLTSPAPAGGLGWLRARGLAAQLQASTQRYAGETTLLRIEIEPLEGTSEHPALLEALFSWLAALRATPTHRWPQTVRQQLADRAFTAGPQGEPLRWLTALAERVLFEPPEQILESAGRWAGIDDRSWHDLLKQLDPARLLLATSQPDSTGLPQQARWTATPFAYSPLRWQPVAAASGPLEEAHWPVWSVTPAERAHSLTSLVTVPGLRDIPAPVSTGTDPEQGMATTRFAWCWPADQLDRQQRDRVQALWALQLEPLANWMSASGISIGWQDTAGMISLELQGPAEALLIGATAALTALNQQPHASLQRLVEHRCQAVARERSHALPAYRLLDELDVFLKGDLQRPGHTGDTLQTSTADIAWLYPETWGLEQRAPIISALQQSTLRSARPFEWAPPAAQRLEQGTETLETECRHADRAQVLYCQAAADGVVERACWQLLHQLISASFFDQLRTRQQLGYWVVARYHEVAGVPGLILLVQSPTHDHEQIAAAMAKWLEEEQARLAALPFGQVQSQAKRLANHLQAQTRTLPGQIEQKWAQALDLPAATMAAQCGVLEQLSAEQWLQTQRDWLLSSRRLRLISRCV